MLQKKGRFVCDIKRTTERDYDEYSKRDSYDWLACQMAERIGQPPEDVQYPIWAWYINADSFDCWGETGRKYAVLTIDIDPWRVVLSDFDMWNNILGHSPVIYEEDEEKWETEWNNCLRRGRNAIIRTWPRVFRSDVDYVQATFWELFLEDVVSVRFFISAGETPDSMLG